MVVMPAHQPLRRRTCLRLLVDLDLRADLCVVVVVVVAGQRPGLLGLLQLILLDAALVGELLQLPDSDSDAIRNRAYMKGG